ncbi:MAG: S-layer homology domain-containing protein [Lawsonibacter sp.]|nr:S-layer homology domain-containing protein [Lawsonibacter sp.]
MKRTQKRLWSMALCAALVLTLLPGVTLKAHAAGLNPAAIRLDAGNSFGMVGAGENSVYFGQYNGLPVKWRLLSTNKNGDSFKDSDGNGYTGTGLFLLSESPLGSLKFNTTVSGNDYQGSDLQTRCNTTLFGNCFSSQEQSAFLQTKKDDKGANNVGDSYLLYDRLFSLSFAEASNSSYGFSSDPSSADAKRATNSAWWIRSPDSYSPDYGWVVDKSGSLGFGAVSATFSVRPAFNMNLSAVLFASAAQSGKSASGMSSGLTAVPATTPSAWKLTLLDKSRKFSVTTSSASVEVGGTASISYTDATSGTNEYISAMLVDAGGNALYYGRVKAVDSGYENGTANIHIPVGIATGSYTLKLFSEQYNGDFKTDYASDFQKVALTVIPDTTPPTVQSITPSGVDVSAATTSLSVSFSEAMDKTVAGTVTLNNGATVSSPQWSSDYKTVTYTLSGLSYAKDYTISLYQFKDLAGNVMTADPNHSYTTKALWYIDENGAQQSTGGTRITSSTSSLTTGWYVVDSSITASGPFTVTGDVKLILADGGSLTVAGGTVYAGVTVNSGNSLTIYGQIAGTGTLTASGDHNGYSAGIGGDRYNNSGAIVINGGTVKATGSLCGGAGIGGSSNHIGGTVTINGGTVTATGGFYGGAGIGSGGCAYKSTGDVTINGGTVTAIGSGYGAGIGGGTQDSCGSVTINGGIVTATGSGNSTYGSAGIGGGRYGNGGMIFITGGTVKAKGFGGKSGIGGGNSVAGSCVITGGSVDASIQAVPTNGSANGDAPVILTTVQLTGVSAATGIAALTASTSYAYGTKNLRTDASGKLYLYLPSGSNVKSADTGSLVYCGSVTAGATDGILSEDSTAPSVQSISPNGANVAIGTKSLSVTFSELIDKDITGTVTLDNGAVVSSPQWSSDGKTVAYNLSSLAYNKTYKVDISGFKDIAGHVMTPYSDTFTTAAESGGTSTGGSSSGSSSTSYQAEVSGNGASSGKVPIKMDTNTHSATADIGAEQTASLAGGEKLIVSMPSTMDAKSYSVKLPASSLTATDAKGSLTLKSDEGTVTVPSNMLSTRSSTTGKTAQITVGEGNRAALPDNVKAEIGNRPLIQLTLSLDGTQVAWTNSNAPVTVAIPYTPTATELKNPDSIVIWYIDGSGKAVCVPSGRYDAATGTVTFTTTHFSLYAVGFNSLSFSDVNSSAWYYDAVSFLAARELTTGTGNGTFSPDAALTRGQFLVMLLRAYGIAADENPSVNFADAGNTYYTGYLAAAKRLGISNGVGNNLFAPEKQITRQEMFTMMYNALKTLSQLPKGASGKALSAFSDSGEIASWAKDAMALLAETGTISGSSGKLTPMNTTTRAEMAQVLYNLLMR